MSPFDYRNEQLSISMWVTPLWEQQKATLARPGGSPSGLRAPSEIPSPMELKGVFEFKHK